MFTNQKLKILPMDNADKLIAITVLAVKTTKNNWSWVAGTDKHGDVQELCLGQDIEPDTLPLIGATILLRKHLYQDKEYTFSY